MGRSNVLCFPAASTIAAAGSGGTTAPAPGRLPPPPPSPPQAHTKRRHVDHHEPASQACCHASRTMAADRPGAQGLAGHQRAVGRLMLALCCALHACASAVQKPEHLHCLLLRSTSLRQTKSDRAPDAPHARAHSTAAAGSGGRRAGIQAVCWWTPATHGLVARSLRNGNKVEGGGTQEEGAAFDCRDSKPGFILFSMSACCRC